MLKKLYIRNYAIIDEISIDFSSQLNIITGETGAGKSILMGALSLILGDRADTSVLSLADAKCLIEGYFDISSQQPIQQLLQQNEWDGDDELIIRREIAPSGKSRAFINDTPVSLQELREVSALMVDLHRQFDTLDLGNAAFQRNVIDALAQAGDKLKEYQQVYQKWQQSNNEWAALVAQKNNFEQELELVQFQYHELKELNLQPNALEDAEVELKLLSNIEGIKTALNQCYYDLYENEQPVTQILKQHAQRLQGFAAMHTHIDSLAQRLQSMNVELLDIVNELETTNESIVYDQKRIDELNELLSSGYRLLKKHHVQTTQQLLDKQQQLFEKLDKVLHIDEAIEATALRTKTLEIAAIQLAKELTQKRKQQKNLLETQVNSLLVKVGMPNARLQVAINQVPLHIFGADDIELLFDANKSNRFEPIRKVASGGELSRLMLCIKSLVAEKMDLPTLIFDEIDTGISGEAARQVGTIMKNMASSRQIICITHQPQIAGKATAHFFVYKQATNEGIKTRLRLLDKQERINAIAQMIGGEKPSQAAVENAAEMVED